MTNNPGGAARTRWLVAIVVAIAVALGFWRQWWLWPLYAEDAFIVLRYAENLVNGEGLVWNPGERVEGYSNLLWILLCAGPMALGADAVATSRVLGALCYACALGLLLRLVPARSLRELPAALLGPSVLLGASGTATWMMGGLEEPLVLLLVLWGITGTLGLLTGERRLTARVMLPASVPFALLVLTRSEGPLWLAAPALALLASPRGRLRAAAWLVAPALLLVGAQLVFRLAYYGEWLPNTAHLKIQPSLGVLREGWSYLTAAVIAARAVAVLAAVGLVVGLARRERRMPTLLITVPVVLWGAYLVFIGGDYFPSHRRFVPLIPLLALLAAEAALWLSRARWQAVLAGALAMGCLGVTTYDAHHDKEAASLRRAGLEWRNLAFGRVLGAVFANHRPLVAVDAAGGIPFGSRLPHVDMLGFNDPVIARTPIPTLAFRAARSILGREFVPGHMHGNGSYVLDRRPDLVLFGSAPCTLMPTFVSGYEMQTDPRWLGGYLAVQLVCPEHVLPNGLRETMRVNMWVRRDGRIGVRHGADEVVVPGLLLGSYRPTRPFQMLDVPARGTPEFAAFDRDARAAVAWAQTTPVVAAAIGDHVVARFDGPGEGTCAGVALPPGRWRVVVDPPDAPVEVRVRVGDVEFGEDGVFVSAGEQVDLVCRAAATASFPFTVRQVRLAPAR